MHLPYYLEDYPISKENELPQKLKERSTLQDLGFFIYTNFPPSHTVKFE
jgi:hypothetical protein